MNDLPIYQSIALDLAQRIANQEFPENSKLSGRSLLTSQYHVSSETIRKSVSLLRDAGILNVSQGKEITIQSREKASEYLNRYNDYLGSAYSLRQELEQLLREKKETDAKFDALIAQVINYSDRLRNLTPYNPVEIEIRPGAHVIGKTIADIRLWQSTGATIIALRRDKGVTISPGPYVQLQIGDRLVIVGNGDVYDKTAQFLNAPPLSEKEGEEGQESQG
ncbi:TrkA C-terminal domain-containing protein [Gorillibacterium timonense]|uniref:TrkA C-terminal domain-containing protein n=1 Tax=Gorillibacterium timonense TaxID=1689269 RepID=UPI00071C9C6A|nr:TrkA C-terminal domain-containing protein [Gorillibacterium timonense]